MMASSIVKFWIRRGTRLAKEGWGAAQGWQARVKPSEKRALGSCQWVWGHWPLPGIPKASWQERKVQGPTTWHLVEGKCFRRSDAPVSHFYNLSGNKLFVSRDFLVVFSKHFLNYSMHMISIPYLLSIEIITHFLVLPLSQARPAECKWLLRSIKLVCGRGTPRTRTRALDSTVLLPQYPSLARGMTGKTPFPCSLELKGEVVPWALASNFGRGQNMDCP